MNKDSVSAVTTTAPSASPAATVKFYGGTDIPLELHKVRVVQKLHLRPIEERLQAIGRAGYNSFLLSTKDTFLDMLTDSGCNAMSDRQTAAMMVADDAYAGQPELRAAGAAGTGNVRQAFYPAGASGAGGREHHQPGLHHTGHPYSNELPLHHY